jgi:hypothetical protein
LRHENGELTSLHYKKNVDYWRNHILASLIYDIPDWSFHNISLPCKFNVKETFVIMVGTVVEYSLFHACFMMP